MNVPVRARRAADLSPARPRRAQPGLPLRLLAALGSGSLLWLAFPPRGWWWAAPLAVAGLVAATRHAGARAAALVALVFALPWWLGLVGWMRVVGVDAWLGLAVVEALLVVPAGVGFALAQRLRGGLLLVPAVWVAGEGLRVRIPFGGFPWGRLAFAQGRTPLTPIAVLGGAPLVSAAVAALGAALVGAAVAGRPRARLGALAAALAVGGAAVLAGALLVTGAPNAGTATVALVQGNVPRLGLDFLGQRRAVLDNHVHETQVLAAAVLAGRLPRPEAVLWPENSSDLDPYSDRTAAALIGGAVRGVGAPTLVGAVVDDPTDPAHYVRNTGIVWDPAHGPGATYVKQHPVPFGEYVPLRSLLAPLVGRLSRIPRDFRAGTHPGVLDLGPVRIGDVICFEVAEDRVVRQVVTHGARVLVVQTNNATYGRTGETQQQLAMAQLRAVEHSRAVLVAATSGVSAVVAPDGRVRQRSSEFVPALLVDRVPLRGGTTPADRLGAWPELVLGLIGGVAIVAGARRRR